VKRLLNWNQEFSLQSKSSKGFYLKKDSYSRKYPLKGLPTQKYPQKRDIRLRNYPPEERYPIQELSPEKRYPAQELSPRREISPPEPF
jgi:hypothetical protein